MKIQTIEAREAVYDYEFFSTQLGSSLLLLSVLQIYRGSVMDDTGNKNVKQNHTSIWHINVSPFESGSNRMAFH